MAITTAVAKAELSRIMSAAYDGKVVTAALVNAATAPALDDSIATWLQHELLEGVNGYARFQSSALASGTWSATNTRYQFAAIGEDFAASGGTLAFTHVVQLIDGDADGIAGSAITASSDVDATTDVITCSAHGLTDGHPVTVTADSGGTLPTGLTAGTLYYAKNVSTDTVSLHTAAAVASGNIVDITATGSGNLRLRKCAGSVYGISTESSGAVTISDGSTIGYSITVGVDD